MRSDDAPEPPALSDPAAAPAAVGDVLRSAMPDQVRQAVKEATGQSADIATRAGIHGYVQSLPPWPDRPKMLEWCREMDHILAAVLLAAGVAYAVFGYTLFKLLVTANVAGLGAWAGFLVGKQMNAPWPGLAVGAVLAAAVAWPAMKTAVAACGGLIGFVAGVAIWRAAGLDDAYAPAGGVVGGMFLFMLSFILFKLSIVTFTAVQGSVMAAGGLLGLLCKYPEFDEPVGDLLAEQPVVLPIVLFSLSVVAVLFQQHYHREVK